MFSHDVAQLTPCFYVIFDIIINNTPGFIITTLRNKLQLSLLVSYWAKACWEQLLGERLILSLNDHLLGKELFIRFTASAFRKMLSIYV